MFHRLRVLNFSKSFLSDRTNSSKAKDHKKTENDEIPEKNVSITLNYLKQDVPVTSKDIRKRPCVTYIDVEKDHRECESSSPMFKRNFTIHNSLSETCPSKKYNLKNLSQRNTMSLIDVKKRITTKRHKYCKNIKLAFQSLKKDVTIKKNPKIIKQQPKDMKLVFECSSREPLHSKTINVKCNNMLTCRKRQKRSDASTSYSNIFRFCNKNKLFDPYSYQRSNYDDSFFQKLKRRGDTKRKNKNRCSRTCSPLMNNIGVVSSGLGHDSSNRSNRPHYNLVDFSRCSTNNRLSKESKRLTKEVKNDLNLICTRCWNPLSRESKNTSISCINLKLIRKYVDCGTNRSFSFDKPSPKPSVSCSRLGSPALISCSGSLKQRIRPKPSVSCSRLGTPALISCSRPIKQRIRPKPSVSCSKLGTPTLISCSRTLKQRIRPKPSVSCSRLGTPALISCSRPIKQRIRPKPSVSCSRLGTPALISCSRTLKQMIRPKCRKCLKKNVSFKKRKSVLKELSFMKSSFFPRFQGYTEKFYHKRDVQGKTILKYVILAIVAVAWCPCLLAIACGWLLTYPLRPQQIIPENDNGKCQKECSSYFNNNDSFWALMVGNLKNAFHKTMSAGSAIKSLVVPDIDHKAKSLQIKSSPTLKKSRPTELPKYPNPQRRYTLCYKTQRGWVMKPVRQRNRNRAGFSGFSQIIHKYLYGFGFTSNNIRQDRDVCAYNVTAGTKPNFKRHGPDVTDALKSTKTSITYKLPVTSKSKHCKPRDKGLYTNPFKKRTRTDAYRKCHHHYKKYTTDKKTGDERTLHKLSSKISKEAETEHHYNERTKRSPSANSIKFAIGLSDRRRSLKSQAQKSFQNRRSSTVEKELDQPISICRKCGKPHFGHSPQSLRKHSASRVYQQQKDNRDTRRSPRGRILEKSSQVYIVKPKRSMSEMSVFHPYRELLADVPKRSLSESSRGPCCSCKSPLSRCKRGNIDKRYSEYLEQGASEFDGPQMKPSSILRAHQYGKPDQKRSRNLVKERGAHQLGKPDKKRSRNLVKERGAHQLDEPDQKRSRSLVKERGADQLGEPDQKRSRALVKEREADQSGEPDEKRSRTLVKEKSANQSKILAKKSSLKKDLTESPEKERFDIKVRRKKNKKEKKPQSDENKTKKKKSLFTRPGILIQKVVPPTKKKKKKFIKYPGGNCLNRLDKACRDGIWPGHLDCRDLYLYTMKKRPCFWVYGMCPTFYPSFLGFHACCMGCFQGCMFCLSLILWSPVLLCLYCCYLFMCESCCR